MVFLCFPSFLGSTCFSLANHWQTNLIPGIVPREIGVQRLTWRILQRNEPTIPATWSLDTKPICLANRGPKNTVVLRLPKGTFFKYLIRKAWDTAQNLVFYFVFVWPVRTMTWIWSKSWMQRAESQWARWTGFRSMQPAWRVAVASSQVGWKWSWK